MIRLVSLCPMLVLLANGLTTVVAMVWPRLTLFVTRAVVQIISWAEMFLLRLRFPSVCSPLVNWISVVSWFLLRLSLRMMTVALRVGVGKLNLTVRNCRWADGPSAPRTPRQLGPQEVISTKFVVVLSLLLAWLTGRTWWLLARGRRMIAMLPWVLIILLRQ